MSVIGCINNANFKGDDKLTNCKIGEICSCKKTAFYFSVYEELPLELNMAPNMQSLERALAIFLLKYVKI